MKIIAVKVFQLKQLNWVRFPFKPEFLQVSSFQLLKLFLCCINCYLKEQSHQF